MSNPFGQRILRVRRALETQDDDGLEHLARLAERAALLTELKPGADNEELESLIGRVYKL